MTTERQEIAQLYRATLRDILGKGCEEIPITRTGMGNATRHYAVALSHPASRQKVLEYFGQQGDQINAEMIAREGEAAAFLSGAYLACGSVTDPEKNYLLEFTVYRAGLVEPLAALLEQVVGMPKFQLRRDQAVLYYRESENIEDALTAAGAPKSAMELMEVKIVRDMRNKVNRVTNCETANIDKTVIAAANQIEDINYIIQNRGIEYIPDHLRELAELRLENPDVSFAELAAMLTSPISKSGVSHRLRKLSQLAKELREEEA